MATFIASSDECYLMGYLREGERRSLSLEALDLIGAGWRIRTPDLLITNQPLYRLS